MSSEQTPSRRLITDAIVATLAPGADPLKDGAVALEGERVTWIGALADLPSAWRGAEPWSAGGRLVTPGLVECHTHLLFGSDRREEFAARAAGDTYAHQAEAGGGVLATVAATARAGDEELLVAAERRAWWLIRGGVTTLEVKTGYGLDTNGELRLLRLAGELRARLPIPLRITLLAGHVYHPDVDAEEYILAICDELLPAAIELGICDAVEVYCEETIGITMEDASTILEAAYRSKIPTRLSADHLSDSAGGALAPAFYAKAAAHLEFTDDVAVKAMVRAGTTAVLLPGSVLELGAGAGRPPVGLLRELGVPLAVSTGCNPGTSPLVDLTAAAHLACVLFGLSPTEALTGITSAAARALALDDGTGSLAPGVPASLAVWDAEHPDELVYWLGAPRCHAVWSAGSLLDMADQHRS